MEQKKTGRLLVVDDEIGALAPFCELLKEWGYELIRSASGEEALAVLRRQGVDLLLTDLTMPGMDGIALMKAAQELDPLLVCIIITGHGTIETAVDAMREGAFDYVLKPVKWKLLKPIISRAMETRRLRQSEKQYRSIVQDQTELICRWEPGEKITYVNEPYCSYFSKKPEELIGRSFMSLIPEDDREGLSRHFASITRENPVSSYEHRVVCPDGELCWQRWTNRAIFDSQGAIIEYQSVGRDITRAKEAEELLRESEEKYRLLFNAETDAIMVFDGANKRFIDINNAAIRLYGYSREEFLTMRLPDISAEPELSEESFRQALGGELLRVPLRMHRKKDGTVFPVEIAAGMFTMNKRQIVIAAVRDISERKDAEKKLGRYRERLSELASEIALFDENERRRFANELHDFIGQNLALARIKIAEVRDLESNESLRQRLSELNELISQASQSTRDLTFELSPPILYEIGFEAAAEWAGEQILKKYNIAFHFNDDWNPKPLADDTKVLLFLSLRELLVNVAKHAKARNANLSISRQDETLFVSLADDGIGFDASDIDYLIMKAESFGLFSTGERLKRLGGRLEISSKPGQGTTVAMIVPLKAER